MSIRDLSTIGEQHAHDLGRRGLVEQAADQLTGALAIIATSSGTTTFRCSAGKDRTRALAAALLLALGAGDADIIADYGRTEANGVAITRRRTRATARFVRRDPTCMLPIPVIVDDPHRDSASGPGSGST